MAKLMAPLIAMVLLVAVIVFTDKPTPEADFTLLNGTGVTTLDPQRMSWVPDMRVCRILFEPLVRNDVFTWGYDIMPGVAERWEVSADGLEYRFFLRHDAKWSNGSPVVAGDFVFAWRRALLPDTAADYTKLFQLIEGSREFYDWREAALDAYAARPARERTRQAAMDLWAQTVARFDEMVAVRAAGEHELVVRLYQPTPYFLDLAAFPTFSPVYPPLVSQFEQVDASSGMIRLEMGWTKPPLLVGNGPFRLERWRFKRDMYFVANEHYWDRANLDIDSIYAPEVSEPNAQVLAFETGTVDWVSDVAVNYRADIWQAKLAFYREHADELERLRAQGLDQFEIDRRLPADPRKNIHAFPAFATYWYNFNCLPTLPDGRANPFADARVRRAFAMAIDKESIVRDIKRTGEPVAATLIPPSSIAGYVSPAGLDFDPARARAELAAAGWPDPSQFPTVELLFNKDSGHDLIAQAISRNWQEHLGVRTRMAQKELQVYRDDLKKANYMTSRAGWYGDYGDPTTFLELNRTGDGNNDRKYSSPAYDALLDAAALELDVPRRMALLSQAERLIMEDDLPMVPIYHYVTMYLFDAERVSGLNPHPRTMQNLFLIDMLGDGKGRDTPRTMPLVPAAPASATDATTGEP
ncbi:MAG: peptide ABC transporter substrate-binding protein [Phycisphaeraceae bacterium]|nr:peptide ABC transporter substrate-binding protein [Phycisphaeraceae bacterium]MCW5762781.1 peptide ABC transporter substrate-binding protein [Phycisphaeraceae bacterium]